MSSNVPSLLDAVFCKTDKGRAELEQRRSGLNSRERSVLIMLDGHRRLFDIASLLPAQMLPGIVAMLLDLDLIAPAQQNTRQASCSPSGSGTVPIPPDPPSAKLIEIKRMMVRSAETHIGLLAADVVRRIERVSDEAQLLSVLGYWNMAMLESKHGREVASLQLAEIKACLQGEESGAVQAQPLAVQR